MFDFDLVNFVDFFWVGRVFFKGGGGHTSNFISMGWVQLLFLHIKNQYQIKLLKPWHMNCGFSHWPFAKHMT